MKNKVNILLSVLIVTAFFVSGCDINGVYLGIGNFVTVEDYENAEEFKTGDVNCDADSVKSVEIYWRSGQVEIQENDEPYVTVTESGKSLKENEQLHYYLKDGLLEIRFAASGEKLDINPKDKYIAVKIPKNLDLTVHSTSADVITDNLEQNSVLLATMSGDIEVDGIMTANMDLSSNSGNISVDNADTSGFSVNTHSGDVDCNRLQAETIDIKCHTGCVNLENIGEADININTTSGDVTMALPKNGLTVQYDSAGGSLRTDCKYEKIGDLYKFGKGSSNLEMQSKSGDLNIQ